MVTITVNWEGAYQGGVSVGAYQVGVMDAGWVRSAVAYWILVDIGFKIQ